MEIVQAHYYYLRVKGEEPAVKDVFDRKKLLNRSTKGNTSSVPFYSTPATGGQR